MENNFDDNTEYNNYLTLIKQKLSNEEGLFIIIRHYLVKSIFYYILCIIFRFIPLIIISGNYISIKKKISLKDNNNGFQSLQQFLKILSFYNLQKEYNISIRIYIIICILIYILFIIRIINYCNIIKKLKINNNKWPLQNKYQIIMDHILFLIFPYIIEFLSFSYYIYLFDKNPIIKEIKIVFIIIIIINSILIIIYNINNYIFIICSNQIYMASELKKINNNIININNKSVTYKCSNIVIYIFILLQNFTLFQTLENYLNYSYKLYYKLLLSIFLFIIMLVLILKLLNEYNYRNFINSLINILLFFCFYTIIFDTILYLCKYKLYTLLTQIIFIIQKIILSYTTHLLIIFKLNKTLENKIKELLFKEKNNKIEDNVEDVFIYLNEIMLKIKSIKESNTVILLLKFLNEHISNCNKINCNCKLLNIFIQNENNINRENNNEVESQNNILIILNYLYESSFLEYNYHNRYDMTILLADHFCYLRENPIMAFSFINSLINNNKNKFSKFQMVGLYELCQKYIYYIFIMEKFDNNYKIIENKNNIISKKERDEYYKNIFNCLRMSYKIKEIINNYLDNLLELLKYKKMFEESISIKFDENNENINYIKIDFFNRNSYIEKTKNKKSKKIIKKNDFNPNLYNVIYLLKRDELYYNNLINSIQKLELFKELPIAMMFKYFLLFDIINGSEVPQEISNKLYFSISNNQIIYNNKITNNIFALLKLKYIEQNNNINSKFFAIYEYKKALRTKYFSEECAMRLGYQQKDIINKKIDELMPNEFCKTHQNLIKNIFIGEQLKYFNLSKSYLFDITNTKLYPIIPKGILIYGLSKNLIILFETIFIYEKEYNFMLNNNFEILAISKNFENEYLLNQKIFNLYELKLLEILEVKPEKLHQIFEKQFKIINHNNLIRQIKTEEYLIPQLYTPNRERNNGIFENKNFNHSKDHILYNILKFNNYEDLNETKDDINDNENLIKYKNLNKEIIDYFIIPTKIIMHKTIHFTLKKVKFIENFYKELTKIPDNELTSDINDNNHNSHNLIINSKKLITKLLTKNEISNDFIRIAIKLSYYYDKPFYFITINDEKTIYLKILNHIIFENTQNKNKILSNIKPLIDKISPNKKEQKSRNKSNNFRQSFKKENISKSRKGLNEKEDNNIIINKLEKYRKEINQERFILIIKYILLFIIICIFIVYMTLIDYQVVSINITENILLSFYYNSHVRVIFFNALSKINGIYYDASRLTPLTLSSSYIDAIRQYSDELRKNFHSFNQYYINYNLQIGKTFNLIFEEKEFYILKGLFKEIPYKSNYCIEIEYLIYNVRLINVTKSVEYEKDVQNFLFFENKDNTKEKVYTSYIRLLHYMTMNYEYSYKKIFDEINEEIYLSYKDYIKKSNIIYFFLEIGGFLLYLVFLIFILIYFYYSNTIIIKNIIFLFLDFDNEKYDANYLKKINKFEYLIRYKIIKIKTLINDFDLNQLQNYIYDINNLNMNSYGEYNGEEKDLEIIKNNKTKKIKKMNSIEKRGEKEKINQKETIRLSSQQAVNRNSFEIKKMQSNNSSYNYLVGSNSNFFKNNLNNNSINSNADILSGNNVNNSKKSMISISSEDSNYKKDNNINNKTFDKKENIQEIILNKSNKSIISLIKKYIILMVVITLIIVIFFIFKIKNNFTYNKHSNYFYNDFKVISKRYSDLYYYFITLKTLFIYRENTPRWEDALNIMQNFYSEIIQLNNEYSKIFKHKTNDYNLVLALIDLLQYNKNDSSEYIKKIICSNRTSCHDYIESEDNIFRSGIDHGLKTCFTYMNNIVLDYKKIKNKTNVDEIISTVTGPQFYEFKRLRKAFSNIFFYIQEMIYSNFEIDQKNFRAKYRKNINLLNIMNVIISILICLFVFIFIFISIRNFAKPIKDSTLRINLSFYYIKKYNFNYYSK